MDDEGMTAGLVAWMREQDALDVGTHDPRLADDEGLRDLDDDAAASGEFEVEQALSFSFDLPTLTRVRERTFETLYDAALDVVAAESMCMLADLTIVYSGARCSFRVAWYEAPAGYATAAREVLAVEPVEGEIVPAELGPQRRMVGTVGDLT